MKRNLLILMLMGPATLLAQKGNFTLKGKIGSLESPARIYLGYKTSGGSFLDSANLINGEFEIKGAIAEPVLSTLVLSYTGNSGWGRTSESMAVYLEPGSINLISPDSLSHAIVSGSKINDDLKALKDALKESDQKMERVTSSLNNLPADKKKDKAFMATFMSGYIKEQNIVIDEQNQVRMDFIKNHPGSLVSLDAIRTIDKFRPVYATLASLFNALSASVKNSSEGRAFAYKLERMKVMEPGEMALPFTQNDPEGRPISLSSFKGQYVLVDFWASWCSACRLENPNVVKSYNKYHDKGFEILSVSLDKAKDPWVKAIQKDGMPWKHVSDLKGWKNEVSMMYDIQAVPQNILIDKTGRIIGKNLKGEKLEEKLAEIFK